MRSSKNLRGIIAAIIVAALAMVGLAPGVNAQTLSNNPASAPFNDLTIVALMNDPRVDQQVVEELAEDPDTTPEDITSVFEQWGINLEAWLGGEVRHWFEELIQDLRDFFERIGFIPPSDQLDTTGWPSLDQSAAFTLTRGANEGDELILTVKAVAVRSGIHQVNQYHGMSATAPVNARYPEGAAIQRTIPIQPYGKTQFIISVPSANGGDNELHDFVIDADDPNPRMVKTWPLET